MVGRHKDAHVDVRVEAVLLRKVARVVFDRVPQVGERGLEAGGRGAQAQLRRQDVAARIDQQRAGQRKVAAEDTWAHLAVCGEEVFVRELRAMSAFRWQSPKLSVDATPPAAAQRAATEE
jgi:hypothetical protein